jgi:hypothetical protein
LPFAELAIKAFHESSMLLVIIMAFIPPPIAHSASFPLFKMSPEWLVNGDGAVTLPPLEPKAIQSSQKY